MATRVEETFLPRLTVRPLPVRLKVRQVGVEPTPRGLEPCSSLGIRHVKFLNQTTTRDAKTF